MLNKNIFFMLMVGSIISSSFQPALALDCSIQTQIPTLECETSNEFYINTSPPVLNEKPLFARSGLTEISGLIKLEAAFASDPAAVSGIRFAVIGDYGSDDADLDELDVAELVAGWLPEFVITVGDNRYDPTTMDTAVGKYYCDFLTDTEPGTWCTEGNAGTNAFFPSLGNHDYADGGGLDEYLNYFTLPGNNIATTGTSGNERYYDFIIGPVHFFVLDSVSAEYYPADLLAQQEWLQELLATSITPWQVVFFHNAPYSSGSHGSSIFMQWPFASWGADVVLAGHDHTYERLQVDGIPYFVNGLGGMSRYDFGPPITESIVRYRDNYGAMLIDATDIDMTFQFINVAGTVIDTHTISAPLPLTCFEDLDQDGYGTTNIISDNGDRVCLTVDGESTVDTDCNDSNSSIHPTATELVGDQIDQNCDGHELCFADTDNDGFRLTSSVTSTDTDCTDSGEAVTTDPTLDCNDSNSSIHPTATELVGDQVDQNCDGQELCFADADDDGYRLTSSVTSTDTDCIDSGEAVAVDPTLDCNDSNGSIHPNATELVGDQVDQNCDGQELCFADADNDGYRLTSSVTSTDTDCIDSGEAVVADPTLDCNDSNNSIHPNATEVIADGVDQDCDTQELCYADLDDDGYRPDVSSTVTSADMYCVDSTEAVASDPTGDCNDSNFNIHPGATEVVGDGVDQNCDSGELCYLDSDNDTYGTSTIIVSANLVCTNSGESNVSTDCDDTDFEINPGAKEMCDSIDNNCDSQIDENKVCHEGFWLLMLPVILNAVESSE